jgi:hypothetical protein
VDPDTSSRPALASTGLSLKIDVLEDGKVVESRQLVASCFDSLALSMSKNRGPNRAIAFTSLDSIPTVVENDVKTRVKYAFRVTGTNQYILNLWNAKRRWSGSITIPLHEARERELEMAGTDGREPWVWTPSFR